MLPIIKWAGGKRQLLPELKKRMPELVGKYVEPFFGSGALFFELTPQNAIINDSNAEIINLYRCIKDRLDELISNLSIIQEEFNSQGNDNLREDYYYVMRNEFNRNILNENLSTIDAALFLFLNKTCYNGLYRVNSNGLFNTPFGKIKKVKLFEKNNIQECSKLFKNVAILNGDFEAVCNNLKKGDFVYFDPPYWNTFDTYQAGGFPEKEHIRLFNLFKTLSNKGVYCMISNSNTDFIKELYFEYNISVISVKRLINRDGNNRSGSEIIITNY